MIRVNSVLACILMSEDACCDSQGTHSKHLSIMGLGAGDGTFHGLLGWAPETRRLGGGRWEVSVGKGGNSWASPHSPPFLQGQRRDRPGPRQGPAGAGCLPGQPEEGAAASGCSGKNAGAEGNRPRVAASKWLSKRVRAPRTLCSSGDRASMIVVHQNKFMVHKHTLALPLEHPV